MNLTDGEANDGDPSGAADDLRSLQSVDGPTLLLNLHVSSGASREIEFPADDSGLPDEFARLLFSMSSVLPTGMRAYAQQLGVRVSEGTRGFVFNADASAIVQFLEIGTRTSDLR